MNKYTIEGEHLDTKDIIYNLVNLVNLASDQFNTVLELVNIKENLQGHRQAYSEKQIANFLANFVRENFTYIEDGLDEQIIQTPAYLYQSESGDCKSFALFIAGCLTALKIDNGFTFAQYPNDDDFTHVYNFVLLDNGKKFTFDSCLASNVPIPQAKNTLDMKISFIGKTPVANQANKTNAIGSPAIGNINTLFAAPMRIAFLGLIRLNFRGYATALSDIIDRGLPFVELFWSEFGGQYSKLISAVNAGKNKTPLLGRGQAYDEAFANTVYAEMEELHNFVELVENAILAGWQPPAELQGNTINFNNTALVNLIKQLIANFYTQLGDEFLASSGQNFDVDVVVIDAPAVIIPPMFSSPDNTPGKPGGNRIAIGTGGETAIALIGAAVPLLIAVKQLLDSIGVETTPQVQPIMDAQGNPVLDQQGNPTFTEPESTWWQDILNMFNPGQTNPPGAPGGPGGPQDEGGAFGSIGTLLLIGGAAYLILKK